MALARWSVFIVNFTIMPNKLCVHMLFKILLRYECYRVSKYVVSMVAPE